MYSKIGPYVEMDSILLARQLNTDFWIWSMLLAQAAKLMMSFMVQRKNPTLKIITI
jgi:hypothetical protein